MEGVTHEKNGGSVQKRNRNQTIKLRSVPILELRYSLRSKKVSHSEAAVTTKSYAAKPSVESKKREGGKPNKKLYIGCANLGKS